MPKITYEQPFTAPEDPLNSADEFYQAMGRALTKALDTTYEPSRLLHPDMRHRVRAAPFKLDALIRADGVTIGIVEDMVGACHAEIMREVNGQQANGEWGCTAYRIKVEKRERRARSRSEKAQIQRSQAYDVLTSEGKQKPDRSVIRTVKENVVIIEFVLSDLAMMQEVDTWGERTGRTDGTMYGGRVPPKMHREYDMARLIIRQMFDLDAGPSAVSPDKRDAITEMHGKGVPMSVMVKATSLTEEQIQEFIDATP